MRNNRDQNTIAYEYIDVIVNHKLFQLCKDCYQALGWKTIGKSSGITSVKLKLERNKKIRNRVELCKLQRECEDVLMELERLVKREYVKVNRFGLISSAIGIIFFIGAIISYFLHLLISTFFLFFGIIGIGYAFFIHHKNIRTNEERHIPEINRYYDIIYQLCKKAEQFIY